MTTPIDNLTALMAKATPLYRNPSSFFDCKHNESVACLFDRDTSGREVLRVHGDYAHDYALALIVLPHLLAIAKAAQKTYLILGDSTATEYETVTAVRELGNALTALAQQEPKK